MIPPMPTYLHVQIIDTMARRPNVQDPDGFMSQIAAASPDPFGQAAGWLLERIERRLAAAASVLRGRKASPSECSSAADFG